MLQNLLSNELIIPINDDEDLMRLAELISSPTDVGHSHMAFLVDDDLDLLRRDVPLLHQLPNVSASTVLGSIVDEDNAIVLVVLLQNRLQVVLVTHALHVVVTGNHDANRQL